ncbi:hypothetical protein Tco_0982976, partial [Tanacetum coccineum]
VKFCKIDGLDGIRLDGVVVVNPPDTAPHQGGGERDFVILRLVKGRLECLSFNGECALTENPLILDNSGKISFMGIQDLFKWDQQVKIDDIDKVAEITLIDETQGRYGDDLMFDTCVLDDEEVFAGEYMDEKEINVAEKEVSTVDPVTTAGEIRSAKSKVKGVVIGEQSESTTRTRPQQLPSKDKGKGIMEELKKPTKKKDQIRHDEEVAQRLQAQMQAKLEEEDKLVRQREE